ncbi:MAG TPA: Uma2 family endonuclease [Lamprocystis sp. (in: g-proteobacteria)]|nr:Uma2 family endonuclease [Lamprocystis sp. (in: g-proteobacteria)]
MGFAADLPRIQPRVPPEAGLDDALLFAICQANRDYRIERNAQGDIQIMPPTGGVTGRRNSDLNADLNLWARRDGRGVAFDSSTGFVLPNGALVSPDCSWVRCERLAPLSDDEKSRFLPVAPDFVIELASPTDGRTNLVAKMREYQENGVRLGWLILPTQRQVYRFSGRQPEEVINEPVTMTDEQVLPGFSLNLAGLWGPGF